MRIVRGVFGVSKLEVGGRFRERSKDISSRRRWNLATSESY
jgi:hypothetical protein